MDFLLQLLRVESPLAVQIQKMIRNPAIPTGWFSNKKIQYTRYAFSPYNLESLTPFTHGRDNAAPFVGGDGSERTGKVTHPSGAPENDLLLVWTPGPANDLTRPVNKPVYDGGIYLWKDEIWRNQNWVEANPVDRLDHTDLVKIKNDPNYNELQPRAVVSYQEIYGIDEPKELEWLPNNGSKNIELPEGTPYGLIGTSSFYRRNSKPGVGVSEFDGLDPFNTSQNGASTNWGSQGADAGKYADKDMHAVRLVSLEPTSAKAYGPNSGTKFF